VFQGRVTTKEQSTPSPLVSVIVPCYNSARTIRECLTAIDNQRTAISYDVIVVDSSVDETPGIVQREFPWARLIHLDQRTFAGAARNIGARATSAEYCLMLDSDCVASPDLLERAISRHREASYAAVSGSLANGTPRSLIGSIGYLLEFKEYMPTAPRRLALTVPTANVAYRRDVLERFGFFDDDMWLAEDILFNWKVTSSGEVILFDPAIRATHINRTGWQEVLSYQVNLGRLSAEARRRGGLPGGILLRYPALIVLMPWVRLMRAFQWLVAHDKKALIVLLAAWPLYLLGCLLWSVGFLEQALSGRGSTGPVNRPGP
jgi:glycosyltransferase involved in cell wall biosynthesis